MDSGSDANRRHFRWIREGLSFSGNERNCVFLNTHEGRFADISAISGLDFHDDARAIARVDWDFDGDVDFWIANRNGPQVRFARNDSSSTNHFLALRLEGTTCNHDAIGARIELTLPDGKQVKTLRAGDGYLSQSSKWLHFGLGMATDVKQLAVRWPGGDYEEFSGTRADGFYRLVQGSGKCRSAIPARRTPILTQSKLSQPSENEQLRVLLASPVPFPRTSYRTMDGGVADIFKTSRPLLVNLWASWCQPCLAELDELSREKRRLEDHVDILALSVDGLGDDRSSETDARDLIKRLDLQLTTGWATDDLVEKIQVVRRVLFESITRMVVPSSLLFNGRGELVAIYEGPVSVSRLLDDVQLIDADRDSLRLRSLPMVGRWAEHRQPVRLLPMVWEMIEQGWLDDGLEYIQRNEKRFRRDAEYTKLLVLTGYKLFERGDTPLAIDQYRAALRSDPSLVVARLNLAAALVKSRDCPGAIAQYREAIRHNANDARIQYSLAWLLAAAPDEDVRDGPEAVRWARKAAQTTHFQQMIVLETLAVALAAAGDFEQAITMAEKILGQAQRANDQELIKRTADRLRLFKAGQPFHEEWP